MRMPLGFFQADPPRDNKSCRYQNLIKTKKQHKKKQQKVTPLFVRHIVTKHFAEMIVQFKVFTTDCDDAK